MGSILDRMVKEDCLEEAALSRVLTVLRAQLRKTGEKPSRSREPQAQRD